MPTLRLPEADGRLAPFATSAPRDFPSRANRPFNRVAYAAAHVVADPLSPAEPWLEPALDWDATVACRARLWDLGLGVAEAMDTAQRGMGLDWPTALDLIRRTRAELPEARVVNGVGTDQLDPAEARSLDDVRRAYMNQLDAVQALDARVILMASRALARVATGPADYLRIYDELLAACDHPVVLHWLGEMFDPALAGYWGAQGFDEALDTVADLIATHAAKIDGIKISLLDKDKEIALRRRLPEGVRMYTGDDFNYPELIAGDAQGFSHALLGIFDPLAPAAARAVDLLGQGDVAGFHRVLDPTVPLARLIFRAPTPFYKTGVVFLAWLNGFQEHFVMVNGAQAQRPLPYFTEAFRQADACGLLRDPDLAVARMRRLLALYGVA